MVFMVVDFEVCLGWLVVSDFVLNTVLRLKRILGGLSSCFGLRPQHCVEDEVRNDRIANPSHR